LKVRDLIGKLSDYGKELEVAISCCSPWGDDRQLVETDDLMIRTMELNNVNYRDTGVYHQIDIDWRLYNKNLLIIYV
jgi:hypothetical protein